MTQSLEMMQASQQRLQQQLLYMQSAASQAQQNVQAAHALFENSEAKAAAFGEQSRKIASMVEASVDEAKQSVEKEKQIANEVSKQLKEVLATKAKLEVAVT